MEKYTRFGSITDAEGLEKISYSTKTEEQTEQTTQT